MRANNQPPVLVAEPMPRVILEILCAKHWSSLVISKHDLKKLKRTGGTPTVCLTSQQGQKKTKSKKRNKKIRSKGPSHASRPQNRTRKARLKSIAEKALAVCFTRTADESISEQKRRRRLQKKKKNLHQDSKLITFLSSDIVTFQPNKITRNNTMHQKSRSNQ